MRLIITFLVLSLTAFAHAQTRDTIVRSVGENPRVVGGNWCKDPRFARFCPDSDPTPKNLPSACGEEEFRTPIMSTVQIWDWRETDYILNLRRSPDPIEVPSPWFPNQLDNATNMEFEAYQTEEFFDYDPEDGWELVVRSFGTPEDPVNTPYFLLTNRRTGMMRGFFYIFEEEAVYNTLHIDIGHENALPVDGASGIFNYGNDGLVLPVEEFISTTGPGFIAFNRTPQSDHWAVIRFPAYYDPCVCTSTSLIKSHKQFSDITEVNLEIEGTSYSEAIYEKDASSKPIIGLAKLFSGLGEVFSGKGGKFYNSPSEYTSSTTEEAEAASDPGPYTKPKSGLKFLTTGLKWLPKLGKVVTLADAFFGGGKKEAPKLLGFNTNYDLTATGTFETNRDGEGTTFATPGGDHTDVSQNRIPTYDNPLGVFALLERPTVEKEVGYYSGIGRWNVERYRLDVSTVKYAVNAASEFVPSSGNIKAGLVFEVVALTLDNPDTYTEDTEPSSTGDRIHTPNATFTSPLINLECFEEYTATFELDYGRGLNAPAFGQRVINVSLVIALTGEEGGEGNEPIIVGRYPVNVEEYLENEIDNDHNTNVIEWGDFPENPFRDLEPEEIEAACTGAFVDQVGTAELTEFCAAKYNVEFVDGLIAGPDGETDVRVKPSYDNNLDAKSDKYQEPRIFPIPASNDLSVVYDFTTEGKASIDVYNMFGQIVSSTALVGNNGTLQRIDVSTLLSGTYTMIYQVDGVAQFTKRIVITK